MKKIILALLLAVVLPAMAWVPQKTVRLISSGPPGGHIDNVARTIVDAMNDLGVKTVIDARPGANASIALSYGSQQTPDGHTLVLITSSLVLNKILNQVGADYDPIKDFVHLKPIGSQSFYLYANSQNVKGDLKQVLEDTQLSKKIYTWAVAGPQASYVVQKVNQTTGKEINAVWYKSSPEMFTQMIGGHIDIVISGASSAINQQVSEGKIKILASLDRKGNKQFPSVNQYIAGTTVENWFGLSMPKNADPEIVDYYLALFDKILQNPETKNRLSKHHVNQFDDRMTMNDLIAQDFKKYAGSANKKSE